MPHNASENSLSREIHRGPPLRRSQPLRWNAISKADTAMSRWVIAAGLKLIVVPVDSTRMRRSLARGSRARASHASRARAGRSRQRQSKWAGSTCRCTRTALVTAPFSVWHHPGLGKLGRIRRAHGRRCSRPRTATGPDFRRLRAGRSRRHNQRGSRTRRRVPLDSICPISVCCSGSRSRSRRRYADDAEARPADRR